MEDFIFNSEISGSSFCSIPSEPPDVRNWFSSYKYESFVLDTCENFGGYFSDKSESNNDELVTGGINREKEYCLDGSGEIRKSDENGNLDPKEDSLHSSSNLSEPPDIRNWFSSYVYESPLLDKCDGLESYVSREIESEENELLLGESVRDQVVNSGQLQEITNSCKKDAPERTCLTKVVKCNNSLVNNKNESHPLFSEPTDIGIWFPSPVLDTSDEFRVSPSMDTESYEDKFAAEGIRKNKQEKNFKITKTNKICSNEFGECDSSLRHDEQEGKSFSKDLQSAVGKESLYWQGDVCLQKIMNPCLEVKQVQSCSINSKDVENSTLNGGNSIIKHGRVGSGSLDTSTSPSKNDIKASKKITDRRGGIEQSPETKYQTNQVDIALHDHSLGINEVSEGNQRKTTQGNNDKENGGKDIAENGFITTKKNKLIRKNDENSVKVSGEILLQCSRNKGSDTTTVGSSVKRKVLTEMTNLNVEQGEAKTIVEVTGKWRCPQKSKPTRGPPLKQLRLEQWIQRM